MKTRQGANLRLRGDQGGLYIVNLRPGFSGEFAKLQDACEAQIRGQNPPCKRLA